MKVFGWALCGWSHMAFLTDVASISGILIISILLTSLYSSGFLIDMMLYQVVVFTIKTTFYKLRSNPLFFSIETTYNSSFPVFIHKYMELL